ncbi:MAG: hypothetical protein ACRC1T_11800 [Clostridium chrysemydis]|uniref:hypothetical protein n=1 Tax=Clostridium TaxID=1485 RepID=UPI003F2A58BD
MGREKDELEVIKYSEALHKLDKQALKDITNFLKGILVGKGIVTLEEIMREEKEN